MPQRGNSRRIGFNLFLGLAIRLALAPWTEQRWDMYIWRLTGAYVYVYHVNPFWPWTGTPSINPPIVNFAYPPVWLLVILASYPFWLINSGYMFPQSLSSLWQEGVRTGNVFESYRSFLPASLPLLDFTLKLPIIACDIVIAIALYRAMGDQMKGAESVTWLWLFNPLVILISAVWGQFDSIPTMLSLLSVLFSVKGRPGLSGLLLALGTQTKLYPLVYMPLILLHHWKKAPRKAWSFLLVFSLTFILFLPIYFLLGNGMPSLYISLANWASPDWFGRNAIGGLTWLRLIDTSQWNGNLPLSPMLLGLLYVPILINQRSNSSPQVLPVNILRASLALYLSYSIINEQYALWFLPFAILTLAYMKTSRKWAIGLSLVVFLYAFAHYTPLYFLSPSLLPNTDSPAARAVDVIWKNLPTDSILLGLALTYSGIVAAYFITSFREPIDRLLNRHARGVVRQGLSNVLRRVASKLT